MLTVPCASTYRLLVAANPLNTAANITISPTASTFNFFEKIRFNSNLSILSFLRFLPEIKQKCIFQILLCQHSLRHWLFLRYDSKLCTIFGCFDISDQIFPHVVLDHISRHLTQPYLFLHGRKQRFRSSCIAKRSILHEHDFICNVFNVRHDVGG